MSHVFIEAVLLYLAVQSSVLSMANTSHFSSLISHLVEDICADLKEQGVEQQDWHLVVEILLQ